MRFTRRRQHPRAGRRVVGLPTVVPEPAPDAPREELVPPPASIVIPPEIRDRLEAEDLLRETPQQKVIREVVAAEDAALEDWVRTGSLADGLQARRPELALVAPLPPEAEEEEPAGLPASAVERLERLTDLWVRQARIAGSGPDATMFYASAPLPPPPPPKPAEPAPVEALPDPEPEDFLPEPLELHSPAGNLPVQPVRVVRDWVSRHDPASLEFDIRSRLRSSVPLQDRLWELGPILDQGTTPPLSLRDASGCVGMATAAAANVLELASFGGFGHDLSPSVLLTKEEALALYDRAQELDAVSSTRRGGDPGTSVLAGMLAGREAGLWSGFLWAFGTKDVAQAVLQVGPVVVGLPWGPSLDDPDPGGVIVPGDDLTAGHALAVVGILAKLPARVAARSAAGRATAGAYFVLQQSRGPEHGDAGRVYLHHRHLAGMLAGIGEAAIPLPRDPAGALS